MKYEIFNSGKSIGTFSDSKGQIVKRDLDVWRLEGPSLIVELRIDESLESYYGPIDNLRIYDENGLNYYVLSAKVINTEGIAKFERLTLLRRN